MEAVAFKGPAFDRLFEQVPEGHGMIAELNKTGDTKTVWNPDSPEEVEIAKNTFNSLRDKGFSIFRVVEGGGKGEPMTKFDPKAAKMVAMKPVVGG